MHIDRIDIHPLLALLSPPYGDANGLKYYRASLLVEATMSNGIIGFGEATGRLPALVPEATQRYPRVIGMDARNIRNVLKQLGDVSPRVRCGLEIALWDALGKLTELPLYQLLGGSVRTRLTAYASLQNIPHSTTAHLVTHALQAGYRKLKMKIGASSVETDIATIQTVRAMLPKGVQLAVDANEAYHYPAALRVARAIEHLPDMMWLEEPMPISQTDDYAALRSKVDIPLAGGENVRSAADFSTLITAKSLDIATPDLLHIGGILEMNSLISIAQARGIRASPHTFDGAIARWAAIHLFAGMQPSGKGCNDEVFEPIEWDIMPNPFTSDIVETSHQIIDGMILLSDQPGLGLSVNRDALRQWRWTGESFPSR